MRLNQRMAFGISASVLSIVCLLAGACTSKLSEEQVHGFFDEFDKAFKLKDADAVVAHLAEDVIIKTKIETPVQTFRSTYTRDGFKRELLRTFTALPLYDFTRKNREIVISPDGQRATVTSQTFETVALDGRVVQNESQETTTLERRSGQVLIVSMNSAGRIVLPGI